MNQDDGMYLWINMYIVYNLETCLVSKLYTQYITWKQDKNLKTVHKLHEVIRNEIPPKKPKFPAG